MCIFNSIREKSIFISSIARFQNTALYPALFALICAVSGVFQSEIYIPCLWILTLMTVFSVLFSPDLKVLFVPFILIYYSIGIDTPKEYYSNFVEAMPTFDRSSIVHFVICGVIMSAVIFYRLIVEGYFSEILKKRGIFHWGLLILAASFVLGGTFSDEWSIISCLWGLLIGFLLVFLYSLFTVIISHSDNGITYLCRIFVCLGYAVSAQIVTVICRLHQNGLFLMDFGDIVLGINRGMLALSWGLATIVGAAVVIPICAALYLAKNSRRPLFPLLSAVLFLATAVVIDTRSAILVGGVALISGLILCCISGKSKGKCRAFTISLFAFVAITATATVVYLLPNHPDLLLKVARFFRFDFKDISPEVMPTGRLALWKSAIEDFASSPIFGKGFLYGNRLPEKALPNLFSNMYHDLPLQLLGSAGIVGIIAMLIHFKHIVEVMLRRPSTDKLFLLGPALCILAMSLFDNFFFYPNFIIIYTLSLAAAEVTLERDRKARINNVTTIGADKKPRVVFAFVEAGKGHIVPTASVCQAFEKKYGDRTEVVRSYFFSETGSAELQETERFFSKTVQLQSRSPLLSLLCKLGNLLGGNTFAVYFLLRLTRSGRHSCDIAVKHLGELDADIIYTAHWAIPFYVNRMDGKHPHTVCFCPDVYSNGAFDTDCNDFLMPTEAGYRKVNRKRMYAGGNITLVPFPMRGEALEYRLPEKKAEMRRKYGIAEDEFVVVLSDGGYGLARLESTVNHLIRSKQKLTIIALCGTNNELFDKFSRKKDECRENIRLIPVSFTNKVLEYLACADVYAGKSGANSIAEPAFLGIPIIVTKCITYIEKGIMRYYVKDLRGALYIPSSRRAAKKIRRFADERSLLTPFRNNLSHSADGAYSAEATADLLWDRIQSLKAKQDDKA